MHHSSRPIRSIRSIRSLKRSLLVGLGLCALSAAPALADQWGVGASGGTLPGLSVQYVPTTGIAYHASAHYTPQTTQLSADLQRFITPHFGYGRGWRLSFYSGLGLSGEGRRDDEAPEAFYGRVPVGMQCDVRDLHLAVFGELAALVGELPNTRLARAAAVGLRATF